MTNAYFRTAVGAFCCLALAGCLAEDEAMVVPPPGPVSTFQAAMGTGYGDQIFFDLSTGQHTLRDRESWDLALSAREGQFHVYLNGAKRMLAAPTETATLDEVRDTVGLKFVPDASEGTPEGAALRGWWEGTPRVWVVDLGRRTNGFPIGLRKLSLDRQDEDYLLRYACLDGSDADSVVVAKDDAYDRVYFSFETGAPVPVAPPQGEWDLLFSAYTHTFAEQDDPSFRYYLVTGVLNAPGVAVSAPLSADVLPFDSLTLETAPTVPLFAEADAIGYDWKEFDLSTLRYTVNTDDTYLLRTADDRYYKFQFVSFLNADGQRGFPLVRYQRL